MYQRDRDYCDTLKLGLLDGSLDGSTLTRLKVAAEGLNEQTGNPGLDKLLGEIDMRIAVELAKPASASLNVAPAKPAYLSKSLKRQNNPSSRSAPLGCCTGLGTRI